MELGDFTKPGEKKKLIAAGALGLVAILFLWWTFIGFGSSTPGLTRASASASPSPTPGLVGARQGPKPPPEIYGPSLLTEVTAQQSSFVAPEAQRNIFAYYEPTPTPAPPVQPVVASTPVPPPDVLLAAMSPSNVYARTADFTLEVSGDKFTPEMRLYIDNGRELPTKYIGPQQMSATVAASLIASPGQKQFVVRTPDGRLTSNPALMNVNAPPTPNYTYIGIFSPRQRAGELAYLQDKSNKEIVSVQRGDVVSGRFRVTSISEKEIILTDTSLKIRHNIAMSEGEKGAGNPLTRPTPRVDSEDDEP